MKTKTWACRATIAAFVLGGCAHADRPAARRVSGKHYVAMGSSFAAGPGVPRPVDADDRCSRSVNNYAHQLARTRGLNLTDVSCGGATTAHILGAWRDLPPQLDAVTHDTALVTITIGGNDVDYIGGMAWAACSVLPQSERSPLCKPMTPPTAATWDALGSALGRIIVETRARAPSARIIFVEYLNVLPATGTCPDIVMPADRARANRAVADRLARLTERVGRQNNVEVLRVSALSRGHDACTRAAWTAGFSRPGGPSVSVPFHPNLKGMTAIAQALDRLLEHEQRR